ncbi:MAG: TVP38/TMEM64 family protein [Halovenus sp.]
MRSLLWKKYGAARRIFTSKQARRRAILWVLFFGVVLVGGTIFVRRYVPWLTNAEALRVGIESYGPLAPAVFISLQAAQVIVAPIPGQVLGFVSGYLFGTVYGTVYSLVGAAIGSYVVFRLSRRYGRTYVERAIDPQLIAKFDTFAGRRGLAVLFAVFLVPGIPDDAICFVAGLTELRIRDMVIVSTVGRLPGYLLVNAAGAQLAANRLLETALLVAILLALSVVGYIWRREVLRKFTGLTG